MVSQMGGFMTAEQGKICTACGESCEGQPRVKDRHGHYYHERCHGKAQREQWRRQEQMEHAPSAAFVNADTSAGEEEVISRMILEESASASATGSDTASGATSSAAGLSAVAGHVDAIHSHNSTHNGASALLLTCPTCGAAVEPGAVVCLKCGYSEHPVTTLLARIRQVITAPISLGVGWLISPKAVGITILSIFIALIALAFFSQTGQRIFIGAYITLLLASTLWAVIVAFKFGSSHGLLTLFVPFYIFYTVYALNENDYLKWLYSTHLMCIPACLVFYLDRIGVLAEIGVAL